LCGFHLSRLTFFNLSFIASNGKDSYYYPKVNFNKNKGVIVMKKLILSALIAAFVAFGAVYAQQETPKQEKKEVKKEKVEKKAVKAREKKEWKKEGKEMKHEKMEMKHEKKDTGKVKKEMKHEKKEMKKEKKEVKKDNQ